MPKSTRDWAKRKLSEAVQSLDWTVYHLSEVAERYEKLHPEVANPLIKAAAACRATQEYINKIGASF